MHRLRKYLGAYLLQLADCKDVCIVFSGGIGENSAIIRSKTLQGLKVRICLLDQKNKSLMWCSLTVCIITTVSMCCETYAHAIAKYSQSIRALSQPEFKVN